jgi:ATP-dependent Clp protease, protease subunit
MPKPRREDEEVSFHPNVYVYGRTLYIFDEINSASVCEAIRWLDALELKSKKTPIEIVICSGGGECYAGLALYDRIRRLKCPNCIVATGLAASMAYIIFLAGQKRYLMPNCILMQHQLSSGQQGRLEDLKIEVEECKRIEKVMVGICSERTGQSIKTIERQISRGSDYIKPERAIKEGIAHRILDYEKN